MRDAVARRHPNLLTGVAAPHGASSPPRQFLAIQRVDVRLFRAPSAERRAPSAERRATSPMLTTHRREVSVGAAIVALAALLAVAAPGYFSRENLSDLFLASLPVLIVALGATLVILTGEIDISVGSVFAICGVLAGVSAKAGVPMFGVLVVACAGGAALGALNGSLVAYLRLPSIVVT